MSVRDHMTGGGGPRTGKALEYLVAASCILMSGGKLNVSTPLVDDEGVDLVFNRHDRPATLAVQIKGRSRSAQVVKKGRFLADVARRTFAPREDLHMLYVVYDEAAADYGPVWLVPSRELAERGANSRRGSALRFATSLAGEESQWAKYRLSKEGLPKQILAILDSLSSTARVSG